MHILYVLSIALYRVNKQKKPIHRGESEVGEKRRDWGGGNIEAKK